MGYCKHGSGNPDCVACAVENEGREIRKTMESECLKMHKQMKSWVSSIACLIGLCGIVLLLLLLVMVTTK